MLFRSCLDLFIRYLLVLNEVLKELPNMYAILTFSSGAYVQLIYLIPAWYVCIGLRRSEAVLFNDPISSLHEFNHRTL